MSNTKKLQAQKAQQAPQQAQEAQEEAQDMPLPQEATHRPLAPFPAAPVYRTEMHRAAVIAIQRYGRSKERAGVASVKVLTLGPAIAQYQAEVLAWLDAQG
jgi:hypothetical protein